MRLGHRGTIARFLRRISETDNENEHSEMIKILEEKHDILEKINSQILQELLSEEEIKTEIENSVEYMLDLKLRLAELTERASSNKTFENVHQSTSFNLNVNVPEFAQCNDTSQGNLENHKTHNTVDKNDDIWDLQLLRRAVKVEPTGQASNLRSSQESQEFIPAANFVVGSSHKKTNKPQSFVKQCLFCNGNHSPTTCHIIQDCEARISIIKEKRVCFNCLGKHKVNNCQSHFKCRICKKTHHTSICYKSQFLKPSSERTVTNLERTKKTESHQLEQSFQLHHSKQLNEDQCKEEEKVPPTKETNSLLIKKLNTKLQKRETVQTRTNQQEKSESNTVDNKEKEDQEQEDLVEKLKLEILQLRRENFKLRRKSNSKSHKIQKIQRENSDLEQKMKSLEDLNNQLQAQMQKTHSNVEPCSETFNISQEMANKDAADLRHYLDELELRVINLETGKNFATLEEIMKQNSSLMTQLWKLDPYTHNNLEKFNFYRAFGGDDIQIHQRHCHKRTGTTFNKFKNTMTFPNYENQSQS